jgi:hypothetical protein
MKAIDARERKRERERDGERSVESRRSYRSLVSLGGPELETKTKL